MAKLTHSTAVQQSVIVPRRIIGTWFTALTLFVVALFPRTVAVGRFLTVDEGYHWVERTDAFARALRMGTFIDTYQTGHPGVTVMWLGSVGVWLHEWLARLGWVAGRDEHVHLQLLRLPLGVAAALGVTLAFLLLLRLFGGRVALLAALLWATEPFLVAHAQLLHLDSTLSTLITLTLLLALLAWRFDAPAGSAAPIHWPALLGAALTTGLALLTKSPSLILVPMVGLIALVGLWRVYRTTDDRQPTTDGERARVHVRQLSLVGCHFALPLLIWGAVSLTVWFALWPALWVDFAGTIGKVVRQASLEGGAPHAWGNFFWGETVADPGPLFYLIAVPFRLTPWATVGLAFFLAFTIYDLRFAIASLRSLRLQRLSSKQQAASIILVLFVLVFALAMTLSPKKFDRYVLPCFPPLTILAAIGWMTIYDLRFTIYDWFQRTVTSERRSTSPRVISSCHLVILSLAAVNLWWFHPYQLAYFNPLLGGGPVAQRTLPVGWGEVYEQAGAYITAQPDGRDYPVAVRFGPLLEPYVDVPAVPLDWAAEPGKAGYAVLYIDEVQRSNVAPAVLQTLEAMQPVHTLRVHGIDYARIYQLPQPIATSRPATFGAGITLRGYDLDTAAVRASGTLTLTLHWLPTAPIPADYTLFVHVLDANRTKIGGGDISPGRGGRPTSTWRPAHYLSVTHQLPVQANAPRGPTWVTIGLYDPQTGARLPLQADVLPGAPDDGGNALVLQSFNLP